MQQTKMRATQLRKLQAAIVGHRVSVDHFHRRGGWGWSCSCLTDGEGVHAKPDAAWEDAAGHLAEQLSLLVMTGAGGR